MLSLAIFFSKKQYASGALSFLSHSILLSSWIIYIPYVTEKLGLSEGALGIALFFLALGAFISMPTTPHLIQKWGEGSLTFYSTLFLALAVIMPLIASSYVGLCIALFFVGMGAGCMDISMNTAISTLEKKNKVYIMAGAHGFFSLGGMIGAGLGSLLAVWLRNPVLHASIVSFIVVIGQFLYANEYASIRDERLEKKLNVVAPVKPIIGLAIIGLLIMVSEGAVADWSALYMKKVVESSDILIGMGYAAFAMAMAIGRFYGDWISFRFGSNTIIRWGCVLAFMGILLILSTQQALVLMGFILLGFGFSGIIPELFRIASQMEGVDSAQGVAFIAGAGYVGFLGGPVLLGVIAYNSSLLMSFWVLLFFTALSWLLNVLLYNKRTS